MKQQQHPDSWRPATRLVHSGFKAKVEGDTGYPLSPPIWQTATFGFDNPEDIDFRERRRGRLGMQAIASRKTRSAIGEVAHLERAELRYG
jgi:O-acetylhomoserine/O-acetylserine sulfhydrylase-like pyridoxal-dependent enzyme